MANGKLRHIAISVPHKEKAAKFYEETFGFERVSQSRVAAEFGLAASFRPRGRPKKEFEI